MKKLINHPGSVVSEMVDGLLAAYPGLASLAGHSVLLRADYASARQAQVALISGGGSGHEPAHAGYVGAGMLSAAVAGEVFTSPSVDSVLAAIRTVAGPHGVLLIVKNYTGDRLNFGIAGEMARAEGIDVATVLVSDDIALTNIEDTAGRRGLAGTVLVHKIAGAAAAAGHKLSEVASIARDASAELATIGVSLSAGIVPAVGVPSFTLPDNEIELGLGIHGEPGVERIPLEPVDALVHRMLTRLVSNTAAAERIVLMINNLGATTAMELALVARAATRWFHAKDIAVERVYTGAFMTSLEMAGVSLTLLPVDEKRIALLDAATGAPSWPATANFLLTDPATRIVVPPPAVDSSQAVENLSESPLVRACCEAILAAETELTELDRAGGDGDLGVTMARGARALLNFPLPADPAAALRAIGLTLQRELGGSSGPLYGAFFLRAAQHAGAGDWGAAAEAACGAISELGGARPGDKTMLDALTPFAASLRASTTAGDPLPQAVSAAAKAAEGGAAATAHMHARRGRASYLGDRALGHRDGGAVAAAIWLRALASALQR